ncbi:MAG TPA: hypothetical protein VER17_10485 [Tepidisphaeraceae bacterium]|nr:hypothetical protein [Tepidisphaeraceae bacterium]
MEWDEIGQDSLRAARRAQSEHVRTAVSRAYYAFHSVLTRALIDAGYALAANRQTPPHNAQAKLIGEHFGGRGNHFVRDLRAIYRRLYAARLDADYNRRATVDSRVSLQAVRDAHRAFQMLEVTP